MRSWLEPASVISLLWLLGSSGCARSAPSTPAPADLSTEPPPRPLDPSEIKGRRIDIEAGKGGYHPERVVVEAGEDVTLVFTRTVKSHCLSEIMIPSIKAKKALPLNQPVAIQFTPTKSGEVPFSCGMDMIHGTIAVQ